MMVSDSVAVWQLQEHAIDKRNFYLTLFPQTLDFPDRRGSSAFINQKYTAMSVIMFDMKIIHHWTDEGVWNNIGCIHNDKIDDRFHFNSQRNIRLINDQRPVRKWEGGGMGEKEFGVAS